jgi:hypothetical protein
MCRLQRRGPGDVSCLQLAIYSRPARSLADVYEERAWQSIETQPFSPDMKHQNDIRQTP